MKEIRKSGSLAGYLHEIDIGDPTKVLIFQVPRTTVQISEAYRNESLRIIQECMPVSQSVLIVGCDVNVYEAFSLDVAALKLKGLV